MRFQSTCEHCGATFFPRPANVKRGWGKFCSQACRHAPKHHVISGPDGSVLVPLTKGAFAVIDADDADRILMYNWNLHPAGYAVRTRKASDGDAPRSIFMHRVICNALPDTEVDHIDRNKLNNRRANLRNATHSENMANVIFKRTNSTGMRGVVSHPSGKWASQINAGGRHYYLGMFDTVEDAARAYDGAARELFHDFAVLNFPDEI